MSRIMDQNLTLCQVYNPAFDTDALEAVLKRRLLPLLEAGGLMYRGLKSEGRWSSIMEWMNAKEAALRRMREHDLG